MANIEEGEPSLEGYEAGPSDPIHVEGEGDKRKGVENEKKSS